MNYMGSKRKFAPTIASIINKYIIMNNITHFYDCCCGGANLTDKIMCENIMKEELKWFIWEVREDIVKTLYQ